MRCIQISVFLVLIGAAAGDVSARAAVLEVKISSNEPESDIVSFEAGREAGISVGDLFWVVDDTNFCRFGTIYFTTEEACAGRFLHKAAGPPCSASAFVLLHNSISELREQFPLAATIRGKISSLPNAETARIDIGRSSGLKLKDTILIRRKGIPIARGEVKMLEARAAMVTLQALVANASAQAEDSAELWPAPGDALFRVNSTVLGVKAATEGDIITIVGNAEDGFVEGRQVDVFHDDAFVGVASIIKTEGLPLSRAKMTKAETRGNPEEGNWAYVRAGAGPPIPPLSAVIFRVVEDYCLIAAGEVDGVQRDEKLLVYAEDAKKRRRKAVAEITIDKVNVDYSGGSIRILDPAAAPLQVWSFAERMTPSRPQWDDAGEIKSVEAKWRLCTGKLNPNATVKLGSVVGLAGEGSTASVGLVLARMGDDVFLYVPPGWGQLDGLKGAGIIVRQVEATATQPAGSAPALEETELQK